MTRDEAQDMIARVGKEIGANVPVLFGIAYIESNFNENSKNGGHWGAFQLADGWGGCKGNDRLDLEKAIKCTWKNHSTYQTRWDAAGNTDWDNFYHYGIHQMGFVGFLEVYRNRNKSLNDISVARKNNIINNKPKDAVWTEVSDWWNYFYKKFYKGCELADKYIVVEKPKPTDSLQKLVSDTLNPLNSVSNKNDIGWGYTLVGVAFICGLFYVVTKIK
jgi:hypothetical protein